MRLTSLVASEIATSSRTPRVRLASQRWYGAGALEGVGNTAGTLVLSADTMYCSPFCVPASTAFDRIALTVTSAGAGGKVLRFGIYSDVAGLPSKLILDSGAVAADAADTGASQTVTIAQTLPADSYWFITVSNGAPTVRAIAQAAQAISIMGYSTIDDATLYRYFTTAFTYAALPATYSGTPSYVAGNPPDVRLRAL